jgi:hypothetical protein
MKPKMEDIKVEDPEQAMERFGSLLGRLLKVPKAELDRRIARVKTKKRRTMDAKRKSRAKR